MSLIGIRHAEIDVVLGCELVAQNFFAVHECAVAAAHVFEDVSAFDGQDLRLLAADAAVAQREFVAGLAADAKRRTIRWALRGARHWVRSQPDAENVA